MSQPAIRYRLIKKEKHTGARLGELITPHGTFPTPMFIACRYISNSKNNVTGRVKSNGCGGHFK